MTSPSQPATSEALAQNLEGYARDCIHIGSVESVNDLINAAAIIRDAIAAQPTSPSVVKIIRGRIFLLCERNEATHNAQIYERNGTEIGFLQSLLRDLGEDTALDGQAFSATRSFEPDEQRCELDERISKGDGDLLFEICRPGPAGSKHSHKLRILSISYPDVDYPWIELSEPGGCGCTRRLSLAQLAHALINTSMPDLLTLEAREICPNGHPHHVSDAASPSTSPSVDGETLSLEYYSKCSQEWLAQQCVKFEAALDERNQEIAALSAPRVEPVSDNEMIERVENILRSKKTVSYPSYAAAEYVREQLQELLSAYLRLRKQTGDEK